MVLLLEGRIFLNLFSMHLLCYHYLIYLIIFYKEEIYEKVRLISVLLTLVFLVSGISASSVFSANSSGEKTPPKIRETQPDKKLVQENAFVESASYLSAEAVSSLKDNSTVKISKLDTNAVKLEIANDSPFKTVYFADGTVEKSYSTIVVYAEPIYAESSSPITNTSSTSKLQVSNLSNNESMMVQSSGTGSQDFNYSGLNVDLYIKMTYTTKTVGNFEVTHLDNLYGKLVDAYVTYFRNLSLTIRNFGCWADSSSSRGITPTSGQNYYYGVAWPTTGTLYGGANIYPHYLTTGAGTGFVQGIVSVEYRHSSETGWSSDQTSLKIGSV